MSSSPDEQVQPTPRSAHSDRPAGVARRFFPQLEGMRAVAAIAVLTCYQGLSKPLRLDQVPIATTQAVTHCLLFCLGLDAVFLGFYLLGEL